MIRLSVGSEMTLMLKGPSFADELKTALVGDGSATFILLNNFEVETFWKDPGTAGLPSIPLGSSSIIVNRMEEFGILLAGQDDFVVLKAPVDETYRRYLRQNGFKIPNIVYVERNEPHLNITENVLACPDALRRLREIRQQYDNLYLLCFGVSRLEEELSRCTGIPLAQPGADVFQKVNSKIYSRSVNEAAGIRQIPGYNCSTLEELRLAYEKLSGCLLENKPLMLKDAMGVSGKGIVKIDSPDRFLHCYRLIERDVKRKGNRIQFVLEQMVDKACDLNYQFLITRTGEVRFHFVKESLTDQGVHAGHLIPSRLSADQIDVLRSAAEKIGRQLYRDGYYGVVGIDAILDSDGTLWPNLEINARFNMSTYQATIQQEWIDESKSALAKHYTLRLKHPIGFEAILRELDEFIFTKDKGTGLLVNNFATVNAAWNKPGEPFVGRLYCIIISEKSASLDALDGKIRERLSRMECIAHGQGSA
jgi:phosphoribosylaminoimidazole carboxylase (NCAIR synthetase)